MSDAVLIQIRESSKAYGGVQALKNVSLEIASGEVHALCGENGAGKSTLIKILTGVVAPDAGDILFAGRPLPTGNVQACESAGIAVMHQESTAFPDLNTIDNIFVGRELCRRRAWGRWFLDRQQMRQQATTLLRRLGETFNVDVPLAQLSLAQRQMVAMARALSRNCRLLIMDEPTASLSARETRVLLNIIRQLRSEDVSVVYVSHRLEEVFEIADRVTVLRDGELVGTSNVKEIDTDTLIKMMVGREVEPLDGREEFLPPRGASVLEVNGLSRNGAFADISFGIRAGEIVGLAGLVGAGRSEVARAIFGVDPYDSGTVKVAGRPLPRGSVPAAMKAGIALVPEDRQRAGLVLPMSVASNLSLAALRRLTRAGFLDRQRERNVVARQINDLRVRVASPQRAAETLSGGNQQKVVLGKWLACEPSVLILDEPTRGIDVSAKAQVHRLIRRLASQGIATIVISSELPELLAFSDRILVLREGRLSGELHGPTASPEDVLRLALPDSGHSLPAPLQPDC